MTAQHWTTFGLGCETFEPFGPLNGYLNVCVSSEMPRDEHGKPVPLYGNRYWPSCIKLEYAEERGLSGDTYTVSHDLFPVSGLTAELARELAAMLTRAADLADGIDKPCCDPCGHWAPCECAA